MKDVKKLNLDNIASDDFLSYATEVIKDRAIPNIEDNLKPVHRRILYTLHRTKLTSDAKAKKSAATVGEVMKTHPHGDYSIYEALIRLGQDWKMRYPLISVQGNIGNINGSPAAAMRYTESKLSPIGDLMIQDISQNTVPFKETYDGESLEPVVVPSIFPNILCNGNMGIAVGMSSSLLPHNLKEVVNGLNYLLSNENATIEEILKYIPGPDLPTGGIITNINKIKDIYSSGSGTLEVQAKYLIEEFKRETHIVFTEIPYLIQIEDIIRKIKELSSEGELEDVINIQNNTGRSGVEIRVILKARSNVNKNLQLLFDKTGLRNNVRIGMTVLENFKPVQTNMIGLMSGYLNHRDSVIKRIYIEKQEKAEKRLHIVDGLIIAVQDIDGVITLIKESESRSAAKIALIKKYELTELQANAVLDMKLSQLTKIDANELKDEKESLEKIIKDFIDIINNKERRSQIISKQLNMLSEKYGDSRRTFLKNLETEKIEKDINYTIALYEHGEFSVIESSKIADGSKMRVGKKIFDKKPIQVIQFNSKNFLFVIDKEGKVTKITGSRINETASSLFYDIDSRIKEDIVLIKEVKEEDLLKDFVITVTKNNLIKKTKREEYNNFNTVVFAAKLKEKDEILSFILANDDENIFILGDSNINKYPISSLRETGRSTQGVKSSNFVSILAAESGKDEDKFILYDKDGAAKIFLGKDVTEGGRTNKGMSLPDSCLGLSKVKRTKVFLLGVDQKGYMLDSNEIELKNPKHTNNKIYNGLLIKIGL